MGAWVATLVAMVLVLESVRPARSQAASADWEPIGPSEAVVVRLFAPTSGALFAHLERGGPGSGQPPANELVRSDDGGSTWATVALPPVGKHALADREVPWARIVVDPTDQSIIYAAGAEGLYKREGDATGWQLIVPTDLAVGALAVSPVDSHLVYLALLGPPVSAGTGMRLLRSQDGGATWDQLQEEPSHPYGCAWDVPLLQPHPGDADRVFRTAACYTNKANGNVLEMSADRGATWSTILKPSMLASPTSPYGPRSIGTPERLTGGQESLPHRFYVATSGANSPENASLIRDRSLYRTDDDGATWVEVPPSNPRLWSTTSRAYSSKSLAVDPTDPDRVYAGLTGTGVKVSSDGGITWADLGRQDLPVIRDLALGIDGQNLYVATDQGVYRLRLSSEPDVPAFRAPR